MYYHRDICVKNVYLHKMGPGVYSDAMLKLTEHTRGSHDDEQLDVHHSIGNHLLVNIKVFLVVDDRLIVIEDSAIVDTAKCWNCLLKTSEVDV